MHRSATQTTSDLTHWDQVHLKHIRYAGYSDRGQTKFLTSVTLQYEDRPDAFSEYRSGFEIRTRRRCAQVEIRTRSEETSLVRTSFPTSDRA
jgi:hypothetical protein